MNRIDAKFRELKHAGKKALIVYIAAGDPTIEITKKLVVTLEKEGVDLVELGIPFSDPLADGPTIQEASKRALSRHIKVRDILKAVKGLRKTVNIPIVFMTYYNPVFRYGVSRFVRDAKRCGADGVIIPDMPFEESSELLRLCGENNFCGILLASPTSTTARLKKISAASQGFIYYVSLTGVTGARDKLPKGVASKIRTIKNLTSKPVCAGFGVSNPEQARAVAKAADGVIVGSSVIDAIKRNLGDKKSIVRKVGIFAGKLAKAVHGAK